MSYKIWECLVCGLLYDESKGWPEDNIPPGTRWEDVPDDWTCPDCGVGKEDFDMVEVQGDSRSEQVKVNQELTTRPNLCNDEELDSEPYKIWECLVCGLLYDESKGWPEDNIPPGTRWEAVPDDWECPDCGVGKEDFEMVQVSESSQPFTDSSTAENQKPVIIIGTGLAGYNLAREFRSHDPHTPLLMITADDGNFYYKPNLSTGFANDKSPEELISANPETMSSNLNAQITTHTKIQSIDHETNSLEVDGRRIEYSKLVIATGATNVDIPIEGNGLNKLYSVNNLVDYRNFRRAIQGKKKVLIIGAGLVGSEYANDMILSGFEVEVVEAMPTVLGNLLPTEASEVLRRSLEQAGVCYHFDTTVERIDTQGDGVVATLVNGECIVADLVLSSVGVRPDLRLAKSAGLETNHGISVNRSLQTNIENIYSLGDCAEVDGNLLYYVAPLNACVKVLAKVLANIPAEVNYGVMPVLVKTTICPTIVNPPPKEADGVWEVICNGNSVTAKFLGHDGKQLGFALTGDATKQKTVLASSNAKLMQ